MCVGGGDIFICHICLISQLCLGRTDERLSHEGAALQEEHASSEEEAGARYEDKKMQAQEEWISQHKHSLLI